MNSSERAAHLAAGNAKQARKRVAVDVLLRDQYGRILLVNPNYKPDWDLPGGMAEANEPPRQVARRELDEELALSLHVGRLLCVEWVPPHGPWDDLLAFIFDGGVLDPRDVEAIRLVDGELDAFEFVTVGEAKARLRPYMFDRLAMALDALDDGRAVAYGEAVDQSIGKASD